MMPHRAGLSSRPFDIFKARCKLRTRRDKNGAAQRSFLVEPLPGLTFDVGNGDACAAGDLAVADFGLRFSRLLF